KREVPRIPLPASRADFFRFAQAGEKLLSLHIDFENVTPYQLEEQHSNFDEMSADYYRIDKLRWGGATRNPDKTTIIYNANVSLSGIPDIAHEYMIGSRSAIEWILERFQVSTDKASNITTD